MLKINRIAVTMQDVADRAKVTRMTVSRVLNGGEKKIPVSEQTRQRILLAAKELNYVPNAAASSLKRRSIDTFGLLNIGQVIRSQDQFRMTILNGVLDGSVDEDRDLMLLRCRNKDDVRRSVLGGKIDGLVLFAYQDSPFLPLLADSRLPIVAIVNKLVEFPSIVVDDYNGASQIANHLADCGIRRALFRKRSSDIHTSYQRFCGFCDTAAARGIDVTCTSPDDDIVLDENEMEYLSDPSNLPYAVVGWRDMALSAVNRYCLEQNLRIPDDVMLAGFDGFRLVPGMVQSLTTVVAPWYEVGRTATTILSARLRGEEVEQLTILPARLRIGETTRIPG